MRHIQKNHEPQRLTQWRAAYQNDPNFGYGLIDASLREEANRGVLEPFCFVLKQAIRQHIRRIEAIRDRKRELR